MGIDPLVADFGDIIQWLIVAGIALIGLQFAFGIVSWLVIMVLGGAVWFWEGLRDREPVAIGILVVSVGLGGWWFGKSDGTSTVQSGNVRTSVAQTDWLSYVSIEDSVRERLEPIYVDYLLGVSRTQKGADWLASTKPEDVVVHAPQLVMAGLQRMPDSTVLMAFEVLGKSVDGADSTNCAEVFSPQNARTWEFRAMSVLDSASVTRWYSIAQSALVAELRSEKPQVTLDSANVQVSLRHLFQSIPTADRLKLGSIFQSPGDRTEAEFCWAIREIFNGIRALDEPHKTRLARRMFSPNMWISPGTP